MLVFYELALVIRSAGPRPTFIKFISFPHQAADFFVNPWNPSRVIWMNLSILCSSLVANLSHMLCTFVVAGSDCLSSEWTSLMDSLICRDITGDLFCWLRLNINLGQYDKMVRLIIS